MVHFDFEFLLLLATLVSGLVWLGHSLLQRRAREEVAADETPRGEAAGYETPREPVVVEYSKAFFPVLLAVLVLRGFVLEPFRIPSGSMMPTLLVGDFIVVNKFSYGLRLPVWQTRITAGDKPKRGDVVVFRYPRDESQDYIKRVVGLPGDRITYYNRRLSVNGELLEIEENGLYDGLGNGGGCDRSGARCRVVSEALGDVRHEVLINPDTRIGLNVQTEVPEGHYFVMGDNRDHSNDSRVWGFVPEENLVGKAVAIWMHWDWRSGGTGLDLSRIGGISQ